MATVIDALVVTLGLNAKGFVQGQKDAEKSFKLTGTAAVRVAKDMEAKGEQAAKFFSKIRTEALAMLAVFTAGMGIKNFTESTITGAASLGRMSENLGMSTKDLQAWQRAAERAGGSVEGMTAQLKESQSEVTKFKMGMAGEATANFFRFSGKVEDLKDGNTFLLARAKIISDIYKTDHARAAQAAGMMGISEEQFNLLKQGPQAVLALVDAQRKHSTISKEDAENSQKLNNIWLDLRDTFTTVGTKVVVALIPAFEQLIAKAQEWGDKILAHKDEIVAWVDHAVDKIGEFVKIADKAAEAVGGWQNVLIALASLKILAMVSPLLSLAGALTKVGVALLTIGGASAGVAVLSAAAGLLFPNDSIADDKYEQGTLDATKLKPNASQEDKQKWLMQYFMKAGLSDVSAAGLIGNLMVESGLDEHAKNASGHYGLAQWDGARRARFKQIYGHDIEQSTFDEQAEYIVRELQGQYHGVANAAQKTRDPTKASQIYQRGYEVSGADDPNNPKRDAWAVNVYGRSVANGWVPSQDQILGGTVAAAQQAASRRPLPLNTLNTNTSETNINGPITINTQATDAHGIMRDLHSGVATRNLGAAQANSGLR